MLFLERPNFNNNYFNQVKKNMCLKKLDIYQNQRKKEYKLDQLNNNKNNFNYNENEKKKIFDTNVLETIENYSTTMTQEPNNEKQKALTPLEIFKLCEDKKYQKKIVHKNNDQKSIITFSESEISYKSKNIVDESMISVIKELSEKTNKFKIYKQEKKYTNLFIKKKDIQKFEKYNNNRNKNNHINYNIHNNKNYKNKNNNNFINEEKEIINKKKVSTSTNKKAKKINFDDIYQNTISKSSSKRASFINNGLSNKTEENKKTNITSFCTTIRKNKGVLNLKKESYKIKNHATLYSDNYLMNDNSNLNNNINSLNSINSINNVNSTTNSKLVSKSFNNIDKLLAFFLTPNNKNKNSNNSQNKYEEFNFFNIRKKQMKKKTTLTIVNHNLINKSQNSKEKFKKITKNSYCKSKSPLSRLFLKKNEYKSNDKKNNIYKKKKSILTCEIEHNSQINKSVNKLYLEKNSNNKKTINENKNISSNNIYNNIVNKKNKHLNIMTLNQANRRNSYQFMKLKKISAKNNLNK